MEIDFGGWFVVDLSGGNFGVVFDGWCYGLVDGLNKLCF